jgi:phosphoribosylamine-glycine ligase
VSFISKEAANFEAPKNYKHYTSKYTKVNDCLLPLSHFKGKNVWILKPTSLNRGKGIHVFSSLKKLKRLIRDYCRGKEQI